MKKLILERGKILDRVKIDNAFPKGVEKKLDNVNTSVNEKMLNLNKDVTKEVSLAMTQFNERLGSFDKSLGFLKESQDNLNNMLGGVKQFGGTAGWGLKAIV